jgi:hypothetical protein
VNTLQSRETIARLNFSKCYIKSFHGGELDLKLTFF